MDRLCLASKALHHEVPMPEALWPAIQPQWQGGPCASPLVAAAAAARVYVHYAKRWPHAQLTGSSRGYAHRLHRHHTRRRILRCTSARPPIAITTSIALPHRLFDCKTRNPNEQVMEQPSNWWHPHLIPRPVPRRPSVAEAIKTLCWW